MREPHDELEGQVAIVTGGANGIGNAIARRYAAEGASVVIADIAGDAAEAAAARIVDGGGVAVSCRCDVGDPGAVDRAVETAVSRFGGVDILVNNAGDVVTARTLPGGRRRRAGPAALAPGRGLRPGSLPAHPRKPVQLMDDPLPTPATSE